MRLLLGIAAIAFLAGQAFGIDAAYQPLWLYQGGWIATVQNGKSPAAKNRIVNDCAMVGRFFACQQTVDGKAGSMIVFVPRAERGDYFTQSVQQDGFSTGRGELHIEGERWVFSGKEQQDGKTIYHRTTNVFSGKNHIHFEIAESPDGQTWTTTMSGDEVRDSNTKR